MCMKGKEIEDYNNGEGSEKSGQWQQKDHVT